MGAWYRLRLADTIRSCEIGSLLVVCTANRCRSPYAASVLRERLPATPDRMRVASAGLRASGRRPLPGCVRAAEKRGVPLGGHRSRRLKPRLLADADLALVMEPNHRRRIAATAAPDEPPPSYLLGDLDPERTGRRSILDPAAAPGQVDDIFGRIERCVERLIEYLPTGRERMPC
jgi:protein-tyrosine phosphatase